jgi:hypothetical protein
VATGRRRGTGWTHFGVCRPQVLARMGMTMMITSLMEGLAVWGSSDEGGPVGLAPWASPGRGEAPAPARKE